MNCQRHQRDLYEHDMHTDEDLLEAPEALPDLQGRMLW